MDITFAAAVLALTNIVFAVLADREHRRAEAAQREIVRLEARLRPRSPRNHAAGYDTGLQEEVRYGD